MKYFTNNKSIMESIEEINRDNAKVIEMYNLYINPGLVEFYSLIGYDFICEEAHGGWIKVKDRLGNDRVLMDTVIGAGALSPIK